MNSPQERTPKRTPSEFEAWKKHREEVNRQVDVEVGEKVREATRRGIPVHELIPVN